MGYRNWNGVAEDSKGNQKKKETSLNTLDSNWKRYVVCSDNHGDQIDEDAEKAFFRLVADFKPDIRVHAGDNWDFRPLRKKASDDEKRESLREDLKAGIKFLERYKPTHFLRGNHDERMFDLAMMDCGVASDMAGIGVEQIEELMTKLHCRMLPYDKRAGIVRIGSLKVIHGFYAGITAARRTALAYGSVLMGHGHAIDHATIEGIDKRMGRMIGCLCDLSPDYARHSVGSLRWGHGFAYGVVNLSSGKHVVLQAEKIGDNWILPTDIKIL